MERIEVLERYEHDGEYSREWWEQNMPDGSKYNPSYRYRRTSIRFEDIERPIEIPKNNDECIIRFHWGEEMVVKMGYDELCIMLNDFENSINDEDEYYQ